MEEVMEKVLFSLEQTVDFGGVGLILYENKYKIAETVIPEKHMRQNPITESCVMCLSAFCT